jgi:glycosyltransferase involved in cell wall biosynthesis
MLTVVVPTRNRARILADVLEAYCQLQPPRDGWKLVVVDNGSTDQTAQVLTSFASRLPMHVVAEPQKGKNFALNTGLGLTEGDLTVFTDDDIFPRSDWLHELRHAAESQPGYTMFGGVIAPRWEAPPPHWVRWVLDAPSVGTEYCEVRSGPVYGITEPTLIDGPIPPYLAHGANMAIRSEIFQSGIRFDPTIGPSGPRYPIGGETALLIQLGREGHKAWHVRGAVVEHFIRREQLAKAWVLDRAIQFGRGQYRLFSREEVCDRRLWREAQRYRFRRMVREGLRMVAAGISFQEEVLFRAHWRLNFFRGQVMEARNIAQERQAQAKSSYMHQGTKEPIRRNE